MWMPKWAHVFMDMMHVRADWAGVVMVMVKVGRARTRPVGMVMMELWGEVLGFVAR